MDSSKSTVKILLTALLVLALLWSVVHVAQQFAPMIAYAAAHDDGQAPGAFSVMAGMEAVDTAWIVDCRERWRMLNP